jgi:hypothetical protein
MWNPVGSFLKCHSRFVEEYPEVDFSSKSGQVLMRGGFITHVCTQKTLGSYHFIDEKENASPNI